MRLWAEFVCKAEDFSYAVFSNIFFLLEADTLKSYNSKGICSIALKFGQ